jgi:hypothetical protein
MAARYNDFYDDDYSYSGFGTSSYFGGGYGGYKSLPDDYKFDPKNPPAHGCTRFHPPLPLVVEGKKTEIYGGACANPNTDKADLYVSLDEYAPVFDWEQPWNNAQGKKHVRFFIPDMNIPRNIDAFKKCVDYIIDALKDGKTVHVGCISGHGRTGTVLSAVVQKTMGEYLKAEGISAIDYVRDNYCGNSVEKLNQVLFLYAIYGVATPKEEAKEVNLFKEMFEKEIGVPYDEIVASGEFLATMKVLSSMESKIRAQLYPVKSLPPPVVKPYTGTNINTASNMVNPAKAASSYPAWGPGALALKKI